MPVKQSRDAREMLRADLDNETEAVRAYRERVVQREALQEYAMAEDIREILRHEQEHQIDLATALGEDVPNRSRPRVEPSVMRPAAMRRPRPKAATKQKTSDMSWM